MSNGQKVLPDSGFKKIIEEEAARRQGKERVPNIPPVDPRTLVMHTSRGTMSFEQGWRYVAGLMSGDIR